MSVAALPFLTLSDEAIEFPGWEVGDAGGLVSPVAEVLENWDYARDLDVVCRLRVHWEMAARLLQVAADDLNIRATLLVGTGAGRMPRMLERVDAAVLSDGRPEALLRCTVSGGGLSGQLRLGLTLTLDRTPLRASRLSPRIPGSRIWSVNQNVLIEDGGSSRFPMEALSFSKAFKDAPYSTAPWYLHWDPSVLQADFSEQVRLYVNTDSKSIFDRFKEGDPATLQAMMGDVISQLAEGVLGVPEVEDLLDQCDEGSVGRQVAIWLSMAFPGQELSSMVSYLRRYPGRFRATALALAQMQEAD